MDVILQLTEIEAAQLEDQLLGDLEDAGLEPEVQNVLTRLTQALDDLTEGQ